MGDFLKMPLKGGILHYSHGGLERLHGIGCRLCEKFPLFFARQERVIGLSGPPCTLKDCLKVNTHTLIVSAHMVSHPIYLQDVIRHAKM